jgi:hypothetical protein
MVLPSLVMLCIQAPTGAPRGQPPEADSFLPEPGPVPGYGRPCVERVDTFDDGEIDLRITYEYDSAGRLLRATHDVGDEAASAWVDHYRYTAAGLLEAVETTSGPDAALSGRIAYVYQEGRLVAETHDADGDGEPESQYVFVYDDEGRLVEERHELLLPGDTPSRPPPERVRFTWDDEDRLVSEHVDLTDDGSIDQIITYQYGPAGLRVIEEDLDADGQPDWTIRYNYGPNHRLLVEEWLSDELDTVQARTTFRYDTFGRAVESEFDSGDDGRIDVRTFYDYGCWDGAPPVTSP